MSEFTPILPLLPIGAPMGTPLPEEVSNTTGEGAHAAMAAMIRQRRMGENHVEEQPVAGHPAPKESLATDTQR